MYEIHGEGNEDIDGKGVNRVIEIILHHPFHY